MAHPRTAEALETCKERQSRRCQGSDKDRQAVPRDAVLHLFLDQHTNLGRVHFDLILHTLSVF